MKHTGSNLLCIRAILASVLILFLYGACSNDEERADAYLLGPAASTLGGIYQFVAEVDNTLTTTCGSATAGSTDDASGDSGDSSSSESDSDTFAINSFYQFETGESLFMKYDYDRTAESFRLTPVTSTVQTCFTTDFINCNGTDGNPTCETTDGVSCGGSSTFIFTSIVPVLSFQAQSGIIKWERGFRLNGDQNEVAFADLEFEMVGNGSVFSGRVTCISDN